MKRIFFLSASLLLFIFAPQTGSALSYNLRVKIVDELGTPLVESSMPAVTVSDCSTPAILGTRFVGNGVYELAITTGAADTNCNLQVISSKYLYSALLASGALEAGVVNDKTATPLTLTYRTKVVLEDEFGSAVTDAVAHYGGFSPAVVSGSSYYFTVSGTAALVAERGGYIREDGSGFNTALAAIPGGSSAAQTVVRFTGTTPCSESPTTGGSALVCAALRRTLLITVKDSAGATRGGATVRVFKNHAREAFADNLLLSGRGDATAETDAAGAAKFALTSGTYYYRVELLGFNDANGSLAIPLPLGAQASGGTTGGRKEITVTLATSGAGVVSPARSTVLRSQTSAVADGVATVALTISAIDGTNTAMGRDRTVTVTSSRPDADTITPATATTDINGRTVVTLRSVKAGESVYTVTIQGTTLSTFSKVTYTYSSEALASTVPSSSAGSVATTPTPVSADGTTKITVTVTVRNGADVALTGKTVALTSSRGGADVIIPAQVPLGAQAVTNENGVATFTVSSMQAGTALLTATSDGIALRDPVAVTFSLLPSLDAGTLIKLPDDGDPSTTADSAVYYHGRDGKRYVFPNDKAYFTWYADFSSVQTVSAVTLAAIPIGGNVTYRPGIKMVKITTDPKVYAVAKNGTLRHLGSEALAHALYGTNWNQKIDDVPDAFFTNYTVGTPITDTSGFSPTVETAASPDIGTDKSL